MDLDISSNWFQNNSYGIPFLLSMYFTYIFEFHLRNAPHIFEACVHQHHSLPTFPHHWKVSLYSYVPVSYRKIPYMVGFSVRMRSFFVMHVMPRTSLYRPLQVLPQPLLSYVSSSEFLRSSFSFSTSFGILISNFQLSSILVISATLKTGYSSSVISRYP